MRILLLTFLLAAPLTAVSDICSPDNNVKDYFLSIPHSMLMLFDDEIGPLTSAKDRENSIKTLDIKNGFIELDSFSILSKIQIVLFRGVNRSPIIMITDDGESVQNKHVFKCKEHKWLEVTEKAFPKLSYKRISELYNSKNVFPGKQVTPEELEPVAHTLIRYKLPHYGKTIIAYASHPELLSPENHVLFEFEPELGKL